jgi:LysR family transcriptional regulator, hydrogen peroxide-inducible genes activator
LTAAGERLLLPAERALQAVEQAISSVRDAVHPVVRLGAVPSLDLGLIPDALRRFHAIHPDVDVVTSESDRTTDVEGLVLQDQLDMGIAQHWPRSSAVLAQLLVSEPIVLIGPPGHPLMAEGRVHLRALQNEWFVSSRPGRGSHERLLQLCGEAGYEPRTSVETDRYETALEMVRAGRGFAVVPRLVVRSAVPWAYIDSPLAVRELFLLWRPEPHLSDAARLFLDFLLEYTERHRRPTTRSS